MITFYNIPQYPTVSIHSRPAVWLGRGLCWLLLGLIRALQRLPLVYYGKDVAGGLWQGYVGTYRFRLMADAQCIAGGVSSLRGGYIEDWDYSSSITLGPIFSIYFVAGYLMQLSVDWRGFLSVPKGFSGGLGNTKWPTRWNRHLWLAASPMCKEDQLALLVVKIWFWILAIMLRLAGNPLFKTAPADVVGEDTIRWLRWVKTKGAYSRAILSIQDYNVPDLKEYSAEINLGKWSITTGAAWDYFGVRRSEAWLNIWHRKQSPK